MFMDLEDDFIESITPDVLGCLSQERFFEKLDDLFCPSDATVPAVRCGGHFDRSRSILRSDFDSQEISEIVSVLESLGGCCDCEVLYNVAETSRLKSNYWRN